MDKTITSVESFLTEFRELRQGHNHALWLRGQANYAWHLEPTIARKHWHLGYSTIFDHEAEKRLLHQFKRYAYIEWGRQLESWEALFLARHYGLPVRLLDWTSNPLVALYFAAEFYQTTLGDGAVWAFARRSLEYPTIQPEIDTLEKQGPDPLEIDGVRFLYPFYNAQRMIAQKGAFTIQSDPWTPLNLQIDSPLLTQTNTEILALYKWKVDEKYRASIVADLEYMDINRRRLMPDLDGLASGLTAVEVLKANIVK